MHYFEYNLTEADIQREAEFLTQFHFEYAHYFQTTTKSLALQALEYLKGLLLCEKRRNMSKMSQKVTNIDEQALSHFLSTSPWQDEPLIEAIERKAIELLGSSGQRALVLDESGHLKQGDKSVGVARQYCGRIGKVDNCQVGVYLAFTNGSQSTLIDRSLYVPKEWINDPDRCRKAGIPEDDIVFFTKAELGLMMILKAKEKNLPFEFVHMDAHYGEQPWLLDALSAEGVQYMADIPCNTRVYLEHPQVGIPARRGTRGAIPRIPRVLNGEPVEVRNLLPITQWNWDTVHVRDTERGKMWVNFAALRVYRISNELPVSSPVWLLIRKEVESGEITFSFSNVPEDQSLEMLAQKQSTRYWVERSLQDAKGLCGLSEYQVISWRAWHHHTAMVLLAGLFLLCLQRKLSHKAPMITLQDAKEILEILIPRRTLSVADAVDFIRSKHLKRFRARKSKFKQQRLRLFQT